MGNKSNYQEEERRQMAADQKKKQVVEFIQIPPVEVATDTGTNEIIEHLKSWKKSPQRKLMLYLLDKRTQEERGKLESCDSEELHDLQNSIKALKTVRGIIDEPGPIDFGIKTK